MSVQQRLLGAATALAGGYLLKDYASFENGFADVQEDHMVRHDYMEHMLHVKGTSGSPYSGLNGFVHWLFDPTRFHFIKRPWVHLKGYANILFENIVPLGLSFIGLTWAFNGKVSRNLLKVGSFLGSAGRLAGNALKLLGHGLMSVLTQVPWGTMGRGLATMAKTPQGALTLTSAVGMGLYWLHMLSKEIRGVNQQEALNFLKDSGSH